MTQEQMIEFMYNKIVGLDDRFQSIDDRFQSIDDRFQSIDDRFQSIEDRFESMEDRFEKMDDRFQNIENMIQTMDDNIKDVKTSTQLLERRVAGIELTLENEIRHNISIIAENHVELNKKLNEVLRHDCERETALIRLNMLETRVRELREKDNAIA